MNRLLTVLFCLAAFAPFAAAEPPDLLVTSSETQSVLRYDGATGAFKGVFVQPGAGGLNDPWGITFGPNGNLFLTSEGTKQILEFNSADGSFVRVFADLTAIGAPGFHAWGPDGNLYASLWLGKEVVRFNGQTGASMGVFATTASLDQPDGLAWIDGKLLVSNGAHGRVQQYDAATGAFIGPFAGLEGTLLNPTEIAIGADGNVYVASFGNDQIRRYSSSGAFIDVFASGGGLDGPVGITFGPDGNLYASSFFNSRVLRYNGTTGAFIDIFAQGGGLMMPNNIRFTPEPFSASMLVGLGGLLRRRRR